MKKSFVLSAIVLALFTTFAYSYWVTATLSGEDVSGGASAVILKYKVTLASGEQYSDFRVHINNMSDFSGLNDKVQTLTNESSITVDLTQFSGTSPSWRIEDQSGNPVSTPLYRTFACP